LYDQGLEGLSFDPTMDALSLRLTRANH